MSAARPLPEFWYPVARILLALKALLAATAPEAFGLISAGVQRELRYAAAFLRRYLLALARELTLPPLRPRAAAPAPPSAGAPRRGREAPFCLTEPPAAYGASRARPPGVPCPPVEWAIALKRAEAMLAALRGPLPFARRLARRLERGAPPALRSLAVPAHVLRAIPPALDILLMRIDIMARPDVWSGLDPDTG